MASSANQPSREKQLLVACARTRLTDTAAEQIRQLAASPIDWEFLLRSAAEHSVLPLLARNLSAAAPTVFSIEQFDRLTKAARASGIHSLQLSAELIRVMEAFGAAGVAAFPYKGPVLAVQAYGDLALREFEDLDILLPQCEMARANEVLSGLGYKPRFPWIFSREADAALVPGEYNFADRSRGMMVELHTERTLRHFPIAPDFEEMARRLATLSLSGHEIRTFCAEDMLVLLCIHGSKDFWERILWIADISEFVQRQPALDWERVMKRAQELRTQRMLFLGLELASRVVEAPVPESVLSDARRDAIATELAATIYERLLLPATATRSAAESFSYRRQMVPGAMAGWRYALRLGTAPAEEDWMMVQLPRALSPLYLALRPLRLLKKYGVVRKTSES